MSADSADITSALRESEERYRGLSEASFEAIFLSEKGVCLAQNLTAEKMFGYSTDEAVGRMGTEWIVPEDRELVMQHMMAGDEDPYNVTALRKDGSTFPCEIQAKMIVQGGQPVRVTALRDVTRSTALEAQLRKAQKLEAVGLLAGGVAHDFNNILQAIQGYVELALLEVESGSRVEADLREIKIGADRASTLTRQLLTFSRGQLLTPQVIDPNEQIQGLLNLLRRVIGEDIDVAFTTGESVGSVRIDPGQFEQILMNLCLNSRDAMPRGGVINVRTADVVLDAAFVEANSWAREGRYVLLRVSDPGDGMDEATLERILEPFFTTKDMGQGTGLGLSTVYGIIEQQAGLLHIESTVGEGTCVSIYLPAVDRDDREQPAGGDETVVGGTETLLLVEDDDSVREIARRVLVEAGYTVHVATDGDDAVRRFGSFAGSIDLTLLDLVMPNMGGQETAAELQKTNPGLKVLYMSGYSMDGQHGTLEPGEEGPLLQKPYETKVLLKKVRALLNERD